MAESSSSFFLIVKYAAIHSLFKTETIFPLTLRGCLIKGTKVTAPFSKNLEPLKIFYICVDCHFICYIYLKYSGVFSTGHFSTHAILDSLLSSISHSLNRLLSFYLSLSSAHSPLCFYLPLFNIKRY